MIYRQFPNMPSDLSLLGFGCMRFPVRNDQPADIIEEKVEALLDRAVACGITYFDTAYPYHGGRSEEVTCRILRKYPRSLYYLADKLPIWLIRDEADTERYFFEQLRRCQTDYFDFYLIHSVDRKKYEISRVHRVYEHLESLKKQGFIRRLGFSFHDTAEVLEPVLDEHAWDFVQIQLNYLDWDMQDAHAQYALLKARGIPCMVMEPTRGGALAHLPGKAAACLKAVHPDRSCASWAIRFAASHSNVLCVLSGMESEEVLLENVHTISDARPFDAVEAEAVQQAVSIVKDSRLIDCTACGYCRECPKQVNIPQIFAAYNQYLIGHDRFQFYNAYLKLDNREKAKNCVACKKCMQHCPQGIPITDRLAEIQALVDDINADRPASWFEL